MTKPQTMLSIGTSANERSVSYTEELAWRESFLRAHPGWEAES